MESSNEKMTSKRKVLGENNEETRSYFTWNLEMERVLPDVGQHWGGTWVTSHVGV